MRDKEDTTKSSFAVPSVAVRFLLCAAHGKKFAVRFRVAHDITEIPVVSPLTGHMRITFNRYKNLCTIFVPLFSSTLMFLHLY